MTLPVVLPLWISISAYGRAWGLTRTSIYRLLKANRLEVFDVDGRVLRFVRIRNIRPDLHQPLSPTPLYEPPASRAGVYFVRCQAFIKIGQARDIPARVRELRVGVPFSLDLVHIEYDAQPQRREHEFHVRFAAYRHRGEWFREEGALKDFLAQVTERSA